MAVPGKSPLWTEQVLDFWFGELEPADWFRKDDIVDAKIASLFDDLHVQLCDWDDDLVLVDPDTALAAIIVLDQFSRNIYRDTPKAFAFDAKAMSLAEKMVVRGMDQEIGADRRVFVYLPFEHSENLADQDRAVQLIKTLGHEMYTKFAEAHRDVILRFGRFPHRNDSLGRPSTLDEKQYLAKPGSGF